MARPTVQIDVFNLMPGLVIDYVGLPAVVKAVSRDHDAEVIYVDLDTPGGEASIARSWSNPSGTATLIGLSHDGDIDSITYFD